MIAVRTVRRFCQQLSPTLYRPVDFQRMLRKPSSINNLTTAHKALKIQQYLHKSQLDQASPITPPLINGWFRQDWMTVQYLRKNRLMLIRIEPDSEHEDQVMYVTENRNLKHLTLKNEVFGQLFKIRACGQLYHTIMTSWSRDFFKYLHLANFKRYYPGKANECFCIIQPINIMNNPYIGDGQFNARITLPAFGIICYNKQPPCLLKIDVSYVIPDRPMCLGDIQNLLPEGCLIEPRRYGEKVFEIYQVDFMDKNQERKVMKAFESDGAKKKEQQKKKEAEQKKEEKDKKEKNEKQSKQKK